MAKRKYRREKKSTKIMRAFVGNAKQSDISLSFFAYVMILIVVGLVMMSSASYAWAYSEHDGDGLFYAKNQLKNAVTAESCLISFQE